ELDWIVMKALEKDRSRRYQTAEALAEDLRRYLADRPILARRTGPVHRTWRWCRRNPAVATLVTIVVALLFLSAIRASFAALWLGRERDTALENQAWAERSERDATEKLFRTTFAQAQASRRSGQMGQRFESLKALEEAVRIASSLGVLDEHVVALRKEAVACL